MIMGKHWRAIWISQSWQIAVLERAGGGGGLSAAHRSGAYAPLAVVVDPGQMPDSAVVGNAGDASHAGTTAAQAGDGGPADGDTGEGGTAGRWKLVAVIPERAVRCGGGTGCGGDQADGDEAVPRGWLRMGLRWLVFAAGCGQGPRTSLWLRAAALQPIPEDLRPGWISVRAGLGSGERRRCGVEGIGQPFVRDCW